MKKLVFTISLVTALFALQAQQVKAKEQQETSNAEKFSARQGFLVQREFIDVGEVKKCKLY